MTRPAIEFDGVSLIFDSRDGLVPVFQNLSFRIDRERTVVLVGRSGCGKTSLLRMVAGLLAPTSGRILIDGELPSALWRRQEIAFLTQKPILLPWKTLEQNLRLPSVIRGNETPADVTPILNNLGLSRARTRKAGQLSGGMLQRAMLGFALAMKPRLLLLDEPFSALDELTREDMLALVQRIVSGRDCSILLVTHNLSDALLVGDDIGVVRPDKGSVAFIENTDGGDRQTLRKRLVDMMR